MTRNRLYWDFNIVVVVPQSAGEIPTGAASTGTEKQGQKKRMRL